ncbi:kinesin family protein [Phlyctema vagabunda]|uniref:Kinesin-like protein n=1 Tax=Phlyctema vagabunda TaxID=108571 RepID=A0ABR4PXW8_9HELO
MDSKSQAALFQVYLRLRPPPNGQPSPTLTIPERFLAVEDDGPKITSVTLNPPNDNRRRAVEKFAFTQVFEENATQLDIFQGTGVLPMVEGVLGPQGGDGRDGLLATLGVTGSGKSHTILGSRTQRGLTQLVLDVLFRSISPNMVDPGTAQSFHMTVASTDASEAQVMSAQGFFDTIYGDSSTLSRASSRAPTPMIGESFSVSIPRRTQPYRPSVSPSSPDISSLSVRIDPQAEYIVVISMYEVYNDRIFDLLTPGSKTSSSKDVRRRPLLFKPTEHSPDRKVVAGLRKVICGNMKEALMVLESGLQERRVAGTGSNSVSSRSHGFFCIEVKKRYRTRAPTSWSGSTLTIVDLAGSERARDAKTQGTTLAEAGKINESLMYLGQCLQMQGDIGNGAKPNLVPYRQCKLTELLFSNSFPSPNSSMGSSSSQHPRNPQKAVMIVTADPVGDFNATSQMLRYSALAREITVPRIPSVTSTILASCHNPASKGYFGGRSSPNETERETMEIAALEIARMSEEIDLLRNELAVEQQRRLETEAHLMSMEDGMDDRLMDFESAIREECYREMEQAMQEQADKWKASWAAEQERNEEHLDKKLEILARGLDDDIIHTGTDSRGDEDKENQLVVEGLEEENRRLRREMEIMKRDLQLRSPSKKPKMPLKDSTTRKMSDVSSQLENMNLTGQAGVSTSPIKKVHKLTARKWEMGANDNLF